MWLKRAHKSESRLCISIIGNQAFSLLNFRGPLISEMVSKGFKVLALAPDYDEDTRVQLRALGAEPVDFSLSRAGTNPVIDGKDMLHLALLLRKFKPGFTLTYFAKPVIYGTLAAWMAGVQRRFAMIEGLGYAFTPTEGETPLRRKVLRGAVRMLYRIALKRADGVFFLNRDDIAEFLDHRLIDPTKVIFLGGIGVNLDEWMAVAPVTKPVTFILAARLLREKGIVEFAKAAKIVKQKHRNTRFILLGDLDANPGSLSWREIMQWVEEDVLEWPGRVPDVRVWMGLASVFVLPSFYREGVPRSIQEAMAMARPIITTDAPGCRETVIEGKNGFLVPVRDADALAAAMEKFVLQPELIKEMGQCSRRIAEERFDVHRINQVIMREMGISKNGVKPFE